MLPIVASEKENLLIVIDRSKKVSEGWHLNLVGHEFFVVEDPKVISGLPSKQVVFICCGDEYY